MNKVTGIFQEMVIKMKIVADGVAIKLFDENSKELMSLKYGQEEIFVEIDLAFKEVTTVRALGLELQSKESLFALEAAAMRLMDNLIKIQDFAMKATLDIQKNL